jgi:DsbC/DsbD-like thiol-disulfide interchange protein
MHVLFAIIVAFLAPYCADVSPASSGKIQAKHAQLELLSKQTAASPGQKLLIGVRFLLEPGWHIYWVNPGDSGLPPVFQWQLPAGFKACEIQWPRPERMQNTPALADYGYHSDVLLTVPVQVSPTARGSAAITLDAKWLICREVCLPDHAQLRISVPVAAETKENGATAPLFAATEKLLPKPFPSNWKAMVRQNKHSFVLTLDTGRRLDNVGFFPLDADQVDNAEAPKLRATARGAEITLKRSDQLLKPIARLRGIVVLPGDQAYYVAARCLPEGIK